MRMPEVMLFLTLALLSGCKREAGSRRNGTCAGGIRFTGVAGQPRSLAREGGLS